MKSKHSVLFSISIVALFLFVSVNVVSAAVRVTSAVPESVTLKPGKTVAVKLYGTDLQNIKSSYVALIRYVVVKGKKKIRESRIKGIKATSKYYPPRGKRRGRLGINLTTDPDVQFALKGKSTLKLILIGESGGARSKHPVSGLKIHVIQGTDSKAKSVPGPTGTQVETRPSGPVPFNSPTNLQQVNKTSKSQAIDRLNINQNIIKPDLAVKAFRHHQRLCKGGNLEYRLDYTNKYVEIKGPIDFKITIHYFNRLRLPDGTFSTVPGDWSRIFKQIGIKAGQTRTVAFRNIPLDFNAAKARISVKIDPDNRIAERDEGNNRYVMADMDLIRVPFCQEAQVNKPDLTIHPTMGFGKSNQDAGSCHLLIAVGVTNLTTVASPPAGVLLRIERIGSNKHLLKRTTVSQIQGHRRGEARFSFSLDEIIGTFGGWDNQVRRNPLGNPEWWNLRFYAEVDAENNVREVFDSNNVGIQVKSFADLVGEPNLLYRYHGGPCF